MGAMKLNIIVIILFLVISPLHANEGRSKHTGGVNDFFELYKSMFNSSDIETFSSFFSDNSIAKAREYFRDSCGFSCRFWFDDSWKSKYAKYKRYELYRLKQTHKILGYLIEPQEQGYTVYLKKETFFGATLQIGYKIISVSNNSLVIDKTILLSDQKKDYKPINLVMYNELVKECLLSVNRKSEMKFSQQAKCFISQ
jgi:hypothetical protein